MWTNGVSSASGAECRTALLLTDDYDEVIFADMQDEWPGTFLE